jgi:tRNA/rRNA methyltransferase
VTLRVVLVRPHFAGNLGSVARAMANFGIRDLVLVDPIAGPDDVEARRMATHGLPVLEACRTVSLLPEALSDCVGTLATGGLADGVERETKTGTPREKLPWLRDAATQGPVALVFGPEPHGLTTDEVTSCHGMIHIPTSADCPSINLSHAVAMCLYEWSTLTASESRGPTPATYAELEFLFDHLRQSFEAIHYVYGSKGDALMQGVRHVISRARPTPGEVRMLHGLARQTLYVARREGLIQPRMKPGRVETALSDDTGSQSQSSGPSSGK